MINTIEYLSAKEWNHTLDRYLKENVMKADIHARMTPEQKNIINEIKKALKRISA